MSGALLCIRCNRTPVPVPASGAPRLRCYPCDAEHEAEQRARYKQRKATRAALAVALVSIACAHAQTRPADLPRCTDPHGAESPDKPCRLELKASLTSVANAK